MPSATSVNFRQASNYRIRISLTMKLQDQIALVTGSARGIGWEILKAFAEEGAKVALCDLKPSDVDDAVAKLDLPSQKVLGITADVAVERDVANLFAAIKRKFGRIDVVVNNAGGAMPQPFLDTSEKALEGAFHFNVTTAFTLSKLAVPHMLARDGGSIVNISSAMGRLTDRGYAAYGTAKGALSHMTRLMASDLAPRIRVNGIAVGSVATSALEIVLTDDDLRNEMVAKTPLRRLGETDDIAIAALYLASPASSFVTGKVLEVDGGIEYPNLALNLPDL